MRTMSKSWPWSSFSSLSSSSSSNLKLANNYDDDNDDRYGGIGNEDNGDTELL